MGSRDGSAIGDRLEGIALVTVEPSDPEPVTAPAVHTLESPSPVQRAAEATIEQTGAGPPPEGAV